MIIDIGRLLAAFISLAMSGMLLAFLGSSWLKSKGPTEDLFIELFLLVGLLAMALTAFQSLWDALFSIAVC